MIKWNYFILQDDRKYLESLDARKDGSVREKVQRRVRRKGAKKAVQKELGIRAAQNLKRADEEVENMRSVFEINRGLFQFMN